MYEMHFERGKISEKKSNLTNESFESIKTIKLYGWDKYFHEEILKLMKQEKEKEDESNSLEKLLEFMWNFLPRLIAPVTFVFFMSWGHTIGFSDMMEVIMLLGRVQGPLHHLNHLQDQIVDLKITIARIQNFLQQPEPEIKEHVAPSHPDHAIYIEGQNYSWGIQTMDVDDMFDDMHM